MSENTQPPTEQPTQKPEQEQQQNPAERRINQLFARAKTAEERVASLEAQQQELQTKLLEVQQENTVLKTESISSVGAGDGSHLANVTEVQSSGGPIVDTLRKEIKDAIGSVKQEFQLERVAAQLKAAQRMSLGAAIREFPDLRDPQSQFYQLTDKILSNDSDLAKNPQGPYKAALMARGVLSDSRGPAVSAQQRAAATVPNSAGDLPQGEKAVKVQELEEKIKTLKDRMRNNQGDAGKLWQQYRQAKMAHGILTGKNIGKLPAGYEKFNQ